MNDFLIAVAIVAGMLVGMLLFFFIKAFSFLNEFNKKIYQPMKTLAERDGIIESDLESVLVNQGTRFFCWLNKLSPRFNELLDEMLDDMVKDFSEKYKKNYQLDSHYDILDNKVSFSLKLITVTE